MSEEKKGTKSELVKSQANYKGNSHFDYVDITIIKDGDFYKKGDKDRVHPATAAIFLAKGLIGEYENNVKKRDSSAPMLTDLDVSKVVEGEKEL
jgi:hypothetical protein